MRLVVSKAIRRSIMARLSALTVGVSGTLWVPCGTSIVATRMAEAALGRQRPCLGALNKELTLVA